MNFYMHILSDGKASILNMEGETLWTFPNPNAARHACKDWYYLREIHDLGDHQTSTASLFSLTPLYRTAAIKEVDHRCNAA